MSASVRWGILGCGSIATSAIVPAIRWAGGSDLVAIASRSLERAKQKCAEVGAPRAYGSYADLLADREIDAVYIGLPNGEHARWAIAAAEAGKHVLCDKSLALDPRDALAARKAFADRRLRLIEGFMVRHHPQWTLVRSLLDADAIGRVRHVRAVLRATLDDPKDHRWSKTLGGGALFDVTCYAINAARLVTREEPARARAFAAFTSTGVDESTDALLQFPSGATASVHGSLRAPFEQSVVVSGDRGRIVVERPFVPHWDPVEVVVEPSGGARRVHAVGGANHFLHMIEHATRCFRDPDFLLFPAEDGTANVAACAMVLDAARAV